MKHKRPHKISPLLLGIWIFYLCAGVFAGVFHWYTGSFASIRATSDTSTATMISVVGQIHTDTSDVAAAATVIGEEEGTEGAGTEASSGTGSDASSDAIESGERHFYRFTTVTQFMPLHLRKGPSLTDEILDRLAIGTTGYIIATGTDWSYLITDDGRMGYCFNGYLNLEEIPKEEYPEDYLTIEPPTPLS